MYLKIPDLCYNLPTLCYLFSLASVESRKLLLWFDYVHKYTSQHCQNHCVSKYNVPIISSLQSLSLFDIYIIYQVHFRHFELICINFNMHSRLTRGGVVTRAWGRVCRGADDTVKYALQNTFHGAVLYQYTLLMFVCNNKIKKSKKILGFLLWNCIQLI